MSNINSYKSVLGLLIALICIFYIGRNIDIQYTHSLFVKIDKLFLCIGFISIGFGYYLRIVRWCVILNSTHSKLKIRSCVSTFLLSVTLNNILPLRAGDVCRMVIFPPLMNIRRVHAIASLLIERLMDIITLLTILTLSLTILQSNSDAQKFVGKLNYLMVGFSVLCIFAIVFNRRIALILLKNLRKFWRMKFLKESILNFIFQTLLALKSMLSPSNIGIYAGLSLLIWLCEAGLYYCLIKATDLDLGFMAALIIMAASSLSTVIPSVPGYFGTFHVAISFTLILLGQEIEDTYSLAIIFHSVIWLYTTLPGLIFLHRYKKI